MGFLEIVARFLQVSNYYSNAFLQVLSMTMLNIAQILFATAAFSIALANCFSGNYNRNDGHGYKISNGYLMMAGTMTLFDTAALGCVNLLALLRPRDLTRYLIITFDVLALIAATAAGKVSECMSLKLRAVA